MAILRFLASFCCWYCYCYSRFTNISKAAVINTHEGNQYSPLPPPPFALLNCISTYWKQRQKRGLLTLIDCAGSERRQDSLHHSSARQRESAEINASLWALKECIRARALNSSGSAKRSDGSGGNVVVPYRSSNLTRLLRESFEREGARLCVIATVAPNATDTEHTCETLKTVSSIVGSESLIEEGEAGEVQPQSTMKDLKERVSPPKQWDHEKLMKFLARKKIDLGVPDNIDGKAIMRMNVQQIKARLCKGIRRDDAVATTVFDELRKENDRVDNILKKTRLALKKARNDAEWAKTIVYS